MVVAPEKRRFTADEFLRMAEVGILCEDDRLELIDGEMVDKMGKKAGHSYATKEALKALEGRLPAGWTSRKEEPVRIPEYDEPEPDVAIVRGTDADYEDRIPTAADVALVVEVSDTTLAQDRGKKLSAYAKGRIPVYWIVDLKRRLVEVRSQPYGKGKLAGYARCEIYQEGDQVPVVLDGQEVGRVAVSDLLP